MSTTKLNWKDDKCVKTFVATELRPYAAPKKGYSIDIKRKLENVDDEFPITFQTPVMRVPFTPQVFKTNEFTSCKLNVAFDDMEENEEIKKFYDFLSDLDDELINRMPEYIQRFKGGKLWDVDKLKPGFRHSARSSIDPTKSHFAPSFGAKVPLSDGTVRLKTFDAEGNMTTFDSIKRGCMIRMIIDFLGIYYVGPENWGATFKVVKVQVISEAESVNEFEFDPLVGKELEQTYKKIKTSNGEDKEVFTQT